MKRFIALSLVIFLNSCAITRVGEIIPGKMYSVDSDKVMDFGIELVLVATAGGDIYARDNEEDINYTGYYSYSPLKDYEGYNTKGNLFGGNKTYSIHLVIFPSVGTPSGEGVAKENGDIKYRIVFPVYE